MSDSMRYNLVTRFVCAKCGDQLALTHQPAKSNEYAPEKSDGITGAAKVEQAIGIHPCQRCYSEATEPIKALRAALNSIARTE